MRVTWELLGTTPPCRGMVVVERTISVCERCPTTLSAPLALAQARQPNLYEVHVYTRQNVVRAVFVFIWSFCFLMGCLFIIGGKSLVDWRCRHPWLIVTSLFGKIQAFCLFLAEDDGVNFFFFSCRKSVYAGAFLKKYFSLTPRYHNRGGSFWQKY